MVDTPRHKAEKITYRPAKRYGPHCRRNITARAPGVLPKSLFGNKLIADAVAMRYLHGLPIGRISRYMQVGAGAIAQLFRRCADLFETAPDRLIEQYRQARVKHAD